MEDILSQPDILMLVFERLDSKSVAVASCVNSAWNAAGSAQWKRCFVEEFSNGDLLHLQPKGSWKEKFLAMKGLSLALHYQLMARFASTMKQLCQWRLVIDGFPFELQQLIAIPQGAWLHFNLSHHPNIEHWKEQPVLLEVYVQHLGRSLTVLQIPAWTLPRDYSELWFQSHTTGLYAWVAEDGDAVDTASWAGLRQLCGLQVMVYCHMETLMGITRAQGVSTPQVLPLPAPASPPDLIFVPPYYSPPPYVLRLDSKDPPLLLVMDFAELEGGWQGRLSAQLHLTAIADLVEFTLCRRKSLRLAYRNVHGVLEVVSDAAVRDWPRYSNTCPGSYSGFKGLDMGWHRSVSSRGWRDGKWEAAVAAGLESVLDRPVLVDFSLYGGGGQGLLIGRSGVELWESRTEAGGAATQERRCSAHFLLDGADRDAPEQYLTLSFSDKAVHISCKLSESFLCKARVM